MINEILSCQDLCREKEDKRQAICCRCRNVIDRKVGLCSWCIIEDDIEKTGYINAFTEIENQLKKERTAKTKAELIQQYNDKMSVIRSREQYRKE
jgi:hypothetical protein